MHNVRSGMRRHYDAGRVRSERPACRQPTQRHRAPIHHKYHPHHQQVRPATTINYHHHSVAETVVHPDEYVHDEHAASSPRRAAPALTPPEGVDVKRFW